MEGSDTNSVCNGESESLRQTSSGTVDAALRALQALQCPTAALPFSEVGRVPHVHRRRGTDAAAQTPPPNDQCRPSLTLPVPEVELEDDARP